MIFGKPKENPGPPPGTWQVVECSNGTYEVRRWEYLRGYKSWLWAGLDVFESEDAALEFIYRSDNPTPRRVREYEILPGTLEKLPQTEPVSDGGEVSDADPPEKSADEKLAAIRAKGVQRVQRWRERNREQYNAYMREYRKRKRDENSKP